MADNQDELVEEAAFTNPERPPKSAHLMRRLAQGLRPAFQCFPDVNGPVKDGKVGLCVVWGDVMLKYETVRFNAAEDIKLVCYQGMRVPLYIGTRDGDQFIVWGHVERLSFPAACEIVEMKHYPRHNAVAVLLKAPTGTHRCFLRLDQPFG